MANITNPAELAYLMWLTEEETEAQKNVVVARDYYAGDQGVPLTSRQQEFLGFNLSEGGQFSLNYCAEIVTAIAERLALAGFDTDEDDTPNADGLTVAPVADFCSAVWKNCKLAVTQSDIYERAISEGEYFVIVDWDTEGKRIAFYPHSRYTDPTIEGDGFGCKAHYPSDDDTQPMEFASKRWTETTGEGDSRTTVQRMNLYYPDRIEKYVIGAGGGLTIWQPFKEDGQPWPMPWVDRLNQPIGIPVIHFKNMGMRTELWNAIPVQDAINKLALDMLASADSNGFRIMVAKGFFPTTDGKTPEADGSNYLKIHPGVMIGNVPAAGGFDALDGADMRPFLEALESWVLHMARVTGTPISRFLTTKQIASEESQKQQETSLLAKIAARQLRFGGAWSEAMNVARKLANAFGAAGLDEEVEIEALWEPAEVRDDQAIITTLGLKREKLSIPLETLWAEAGYSRQEIEEMKATEEYQARSSQMQMASIGLAAMRESQQDGKRPPTDNQGSGESE